MYFLCISKETYLTWQPKTNYHYLPFALITKLSQLLINHNSFKNEQTGPRRVWVYLFSTSSKHLLHNDVNHFINSQRLKFIHALFLPCVCSSKGSYLLLNFKTALNILRQLVLVFFPSMRTLYSLV